jgi:signal transduction histidine kinase
MIGYAKTLRQPQFANDESLREEFLGRMERQGNRFGRPGREPADHFAPGERPTLHLDRRVLFEDLCRETVEGLGADVDRIVTDVPEDIPVLHTDRQLLSRVLTNLLDNALKYSPEDTMCELGARAEGDRLVFWVRDRGIGIEPGQMERIFERFYQVDSSSTRRFSGAGLGLSMVRDLMQHLGGTVTVESTPDNGSTFTVHMPIQAPDAEAATG